MVCGAGVHNFILGSAVSFVSLSLPLFSGVLRSRLPASLFEHASGGPGSPPNDAMDHTLCSLCSDAPEPCNNRMCVIAKRLGSLHRLAHAAGRVHFLGASMTPRTVFLICSRPFTLRTSIQKLAIISLRHGCPRFLLQRVFNAPPGAPFWAHFLFFTSHITSVCAAFNACLRCHTRYA